MIKKNISKKVAAVAVSMVLSVMSCMLVSADYVHEIGWDEDPCPKCGEDVAVWIRDVYGDTERTGIEEKCPHYTLGNDVEMVRPGYREFECRECGYSWGYSMSYYYWICEGYGSLIRN